MLRSRSATRYRLALRFAACPPAFDHLQGFCCKQVPTVAEDRLPPWQEICTNSMGSYARGCTSVRARHRRFTLLWQVEQTMTDVVGWATKKTSDGQWDRMSPPSQSLLRDVHSERFCTKDRLWDWHLFTSQNTGLISGEINQPLGTAARSFSSRYTLQTLSGAMTLIQGTGCFASLFKLARPQNMPGRALPRGEYSDREMEGPI